MHFFPVSLEMQTKDRWLIGNKNGESTNTTTQPRPQFNKIPLYTIGILNFWHGKMEYTNTLYVNETSSGLSPGYF